MFKRTSDPAFDMEAPVLKDDSVRDYQYYSCHAIQPDLRSRIELQVHDTSKYFLPCEAFIEIEGKLVTNVTADTAFTNDPNIRVGFVNNSIMALFESARYLIDGKEIESIDLEVDVATTIIGLAIYSDDYTRSVGPSMMFAKDTSDHADHLQYIKARSPRATLDDDQQEAVNPERRAKPAGAIRIDIMREVNGNFNLGFATRVAKLQRQQRHNASNDSINYHGAAYTLIYGHRRQIIANLANNND